VKLTTVAALLLGFVPLSAIAADHDFNDAVSSIEHNYHLHRQHIPLIGLASFCAHIATSGAVRGIRIAAFAEDARLPGGADLPKLLQGTLGSSWSLIVESRSRGTSPGAAAANAGQFEAGEQDAIFAHPHGERMTLLVAAYDHEGLSLVRVDLNGAQFGKWMHDPVRHARHPETD
jgi:hypothetical protein